MIEARQSVADVLDVSAMLIDPGVLWVQVHELLRPGT